jgi:hypothetical protein
VPSTLQAAPADLFNVLKAGDALFIDSSHILMPGSDADILLNRVLPAAPAGTLVHIHDIFLPFDYPAIWGWRAYNEQQGVVPMLTTGAYRPLFSSAWAEPPGGRLARRWWRACRAGRRAPPASGSKSVMLGRLRGWLFGTSGVERCRAVRGRSAGSRNRRDPDRLGRAGAVAVGFAYETTSMRPAWCGKTIVRSYVFACMPFSGPPGWPIAACRNGCSMSVVIDMAALA